MASVKSPLMTAAAQGPGSGPGSGPGPIVGSAPAPSTTATTGPGSSGYFNQQSTQPPQHTTSHSYAAPSHLPMRSPYTDSQNFMPSSQQVLSAEDDQTFLNTIANSQAQAQQAQSLSQSQTYLPSSTAAPGGRNSPYPYNTIDASGDVGANNSLAANAMANNYNHSVGAGAGSGSGAGATPSAVGGPNGRFAENWDASQRGSSLMDGDGGAFSDGGASMQLPSRSNTLKKKSSLRRATSLHRSSSRRSMKAGSVRSLALQSRSDEDESQSAFFCPVPTKGNPTEVLASRFHAWRKVLKDLISYHREIQNHYEQRTKSLQRLAATLNGSTLPPGFMATGGLDDAAQQLRSFHKQAVSEATKAREIEEDVILALTGLRTDLSQKIKEIKNISGDFRNNVDKEMDATKKAVKNLQDNLGQAELDSAMTTGRQDPYLLRLLADRQLERQIQEENYLHQAFLNLEKSGRELESIVVGEIQKSYNAYVGILRREAGAIWATVDELREGPIAMPKDKEWLSFVRGSDQFIGPEVPIRSFQFISYPGQNHFACQEIRAGLLERKSKYLKSYTAGWYVLSPTHLHEFKSADKMQAPVMSLYLPEQKLGSHSTESASSSKFVLKGRQTGGLHRGHTWVFRAESYDTMMAWFDDLYALTEKTPQEREDFARGHQHTRSVSRASQHTYSSDGVVNEDDDEPFAVNSLAAMAGAAAGAKAAEDVLGGGVLTRQSSVMSDAAASGAGGSGVGGGVGGVAVARAVDAQALSPDGQSSQYRLQSATPNRRPSQGGRFPSDLQVNAQRGLEVQAAGIPVSPTSAGGSGSNQGSAGPGSDYGVIAAAGALPGSHQEALAPNNYNAHQEQLSLQQLQQQQQQQLLQQQLLQQQLLQQQQQAQYVQPQYQQAQFQQPPQQQQQQDPYAAAPHFYQTQQPDSAAQQQYATSQAALAAQAKQAPATVAPVISMFVNVNDKSPSTTDSGKVFNSSDAGVDGSGGAPVANGHVVNAYTSTEGYYDGTNREQQQQQQPVYAPSEVRPPAESFAGTAEAPLLVAQTNGVVNGVSRESIGETGNGNVDTKLAAGRPSLVSPQKSEAITLSNLHIPGQFPAAATDSR